MHEHQSEVVVRFTLRELFTYCKESKEFGHLIGHIRIVGGEASHLSREYCLARLRDVYSESLAGQEWINPAFEKELESLPADCDIQIDASAMTAEKRIAAFHLMLQFWAGKIKNETFSHTAFYECLQCLNGYYSNLKIY